MKKHLLLFIFLNSLLSSDENIYLQLGVNITPNIEKISSNKQNMNTSFLNSMLQTPVSSIEFNKSKLNETKTAINSKNKKIIFLTFDDGPLLGTNNILNIINDEKIYATMFMVGKHINMNQSLYKKALKNSYVTIANHTFSHANGKYRKFYSNSVKLLTDIKKNNNILSHSSDNNLSLFYPLRLAGRNVFRLPGISCDDKGLGKKQCKKEHSKYNNIEKEGFFIYGWDLEWHFNPRNGSPIGSPKSVVRKLETIYSKNHSKIKGKVILLMHDFMFKNKHKGKTKLIQLIYLLKKGGWTFAPLKNYITNKI